MTEHECPDCDRHFDSLRGVSAHHRQSHEGQFNAELQRECVVCGDDFTKYPSQDRVCCSKDCGYKYRNLPSGENSSLYKPETTVECQQCEEEFKADGWKLERGQGRFCSPECWSRYCKEHPERRSFNGYGSGFTEAKRKVRERDENCQICGEDGVEYRLEVHHIKPVKSFDNRSNAHNTDNLVLLCAPCHRHVEAGRVEEILKRSESNSVIKYVPPNKRPNVLKGAN